MNFPDPSEDAGGPYSPLSGSPGRHRLARSFRMPSAFSSEAPPPLGRSGPLDLRVDGGYVERHAAPAWWISPRSFVPNLMEMNVVASFWVKPSYPPDRSGKPRMLFNVIQDTKPNYFERKAYLMLLQNAGHENVPGEVSDSEDVSRCGEQQWSDPKGLYYGFAPFRPQSFILGRGYGPTGGNVPDVPKYYASCQTVVNHEGHADHGERESPFREHRWTHVVLTTRARPDKNVPGDGWYEAYDPPRWTSILVNGRLLKGTRETMLSQVFEGGVGGDSKVDMTVHWGGDNNSVRFGAPSRVTRAGPVRPNYASDATIDEFLLWNHSSTSEQQKAVSGWLNGRYAKPLQRQDDPEESEGVFVSQLIELPSAVRRPAPPSGPLSRRTQSIDQPEREILGIAWTASGEDASDVEPSVADGATGRRLPVRVSTHLKAAGRRSGPFTNDGFSPASVRVREGEKLQYLVQFEIEGLTSRTILLTSPVVDDITLYVRPLGGTRYLAYSLTNVTGAAP